MSIILWSLIAQNQSKVWTHHILLGVQAAKVVQRASVGHPLDISSKYIRHRIIIPHFIVFLIQ